MSRHSIVIWFFAAAALFTVACGGSAKKSGKLENSADSLSYVVGMNIAYNIMNMDTTMRAEAIIAGIEDAFAGAEKMTLDEGRTYLLAYMNFDVYERVRKYEEQYLTDLAASDGNVVRTKSGLTYKVGGLPHAPEQFITYFEEDNRPQAKLDRDLYGGMGVTVGRLREDAWFDYKFVCLSHNTLRGAAGGAVLNAELLYKLGYFD